jgi:hypothetical protein
VKRTCTAVVLLALSAACSSGSSGSSGPKQPAVSAFTAGTCRTAAPDVLTIGKRVRELGNDKSPSAGPLDAMTAAQDRLDPIASAAEPAYQPALRSLVTAVGLVRLRAHTGSYVPSLGQAVTSAYDGVLKVCTQ